MKPITELSRNELSLWLATAFEPKPTYKPRLINAHSSIGGIKVQKYSEYGWWETAFSDKSWQPRRYDDPEIVVRLLKWLIEREYSLVPTWDFTASPYKFHGFALVNYDVEIDQRSESIERAIAEGAALAKGFV